MSAVAPPEHQESFAVAVELLRVIRGCKTRGKRSLRWPVSQLVIRAPADVRSALAPVLDDVLHAGAVQTGTWRLEDGTAPEGAAMEVEVMLAEEES